MKKLILLGCFFLSVTAVCGQQPIKLSDINMTNLEDGRLYATKDDSKKKPIDGKVRIITGYTTEYLNAQFAKGYATGKWEYYKDNVLTEVKHYSDGLLHGEIIEYYADGKTVKNHAVMKNGKPDGIVERFSQDGKKTYEKGMKEGVSDGYERNYADDGTVLSETFYKDGKQDGISFSITSRGASNEVKTTTGYKEGIQDGEYLAIYADGSVKTKGTYKDGKKEGLWEAFKRDGKHDKPTEVYENGNVVKRTTYYTDDSIKTETHFNKEKKKHGIEKEYAFDGGHLIREQIFVNGKLLGKQMRRVSSNHGAYFEHAVYNEAGQKDGEFTETWEESGNMKANGLYVKDKKQGLWVYGYPDNRYPGPEENYENGIRKSQKIYVINENTGDYIELFHYDDRDNYDGDYLATWVKGGKTKVKGQYEKGRRQGVWVTYDINGKPLEESTYENGNQTKHTKF
jgi:antitoxin component YwqK of YwqJK toxin-antitoxin module